VTHARFAPGSESDKEETVPTQQRIAIDDIVEAATVGVLRALESRKISGEAFTQENGFFVRFAVYAGGFPGPIEIAPGVAAGAREGGV